MFERIYESTVHLSNELGDILQFLRSLLSEAAVFLGNQMKILVWNKNLYQSIINLDAQRNTKNVNFNNCGTQLKIYRISYYCFYNQDIPMKKYWHIYCAGQWKFLHKYLTSGWFDGGGIVKVQCQHWYLLDIMELCRNYVNPTDSLKCAISTPSGSDESLCSRQRRIPRFLRNSATTSFST